jgi:hypothetical protein
MSPEGGRVGGVVSPLHTEEREGGGSMCGGERGGGVHARSTVASRGGWVGICPEDKNMRNVFQDLGGTWQLRGKLRAIWADVCL